MFVVLAASSGIALSDADKEKEVEEQEFQISGDVEKGRVIYEQVCLACHGEKGDGQGPVGRDLAIHLPDFTDAGHMFSLTDRYLFRVVKEGGVSVGKSGIMHSWESVLTTQHIHDVLAYIKTFAKTYAQASVLSPSHSELLKQ